MFFSTIFLCAVVFQLGTANKTKHETNQTALACTGRALFFDETPCLSGILNKIGIGKKCDSTTIVNLLTTEFNKLATVTGGKRCPWAYNYELQLITKTLNYDKALLALGDMCKAVVPPEKDTIKVDWTDIDRRLDPLFLANFTNGGTYLNDMIGNFKNPAGQPTDTRKNNPFPTDEDSYTMGISIDNFYKNGALTKVVNPVPNLDQCKHQTIMCCFGHDRQSGDNNGGCAPHKGHCEKAVPGDNTNVCNDFTNPQYGLRDPARGEHCHGFAWSNNPDSLSYKMRFNNFFYVSFYDHLYMRGYVKSVYNNNAQMCGCIEDMPDVSRADCTEVALNADYKLSISSIGDLYIDVDTSAIEFNACQGIVPRSGTLRTPTTNDLHAHVEKIFQENQMSVLSRKAIAGSFPSC